MYGDQKTVRALSQGLRNDRLIQIFVGEDATTDSKLARPFLVQESLLHRVSEYFVAATKHESLGTADAGVLKFPEDNIDAWELLLNWFFTAQVPHKSRGKVDDFVSSMCLVNCYVLADKYIIPKLQNEIMIETIFRNGTTTFEEETARRALITAPAESPLRKLVMEDLMAQLGTEVLSVTELERILDGIPGTMGLMLQATTNWRVPVNRRRLRLFRGSLAWTTYMVKAHASEPSLPDMHWLWDEQHLADEQSYYVARFPGR